MLDFLRRLRSRPSLTYAPNGWATTVDDPRGYDTPEVADVYRSKWSEHVTGLGADGAALGSGSVLTHNVYVTYAYVLTRVALTSSRPLSILDYGASTGHYAQLARHVLPDVPFTYHAFDVPHVAAMGREVNPAVEWMADERDIGTDYDLIMLSGSLQCLPDWRAVLSRLAPRTRWLYVARLPVVKTGPGFVGLQQVYGTTMLFGVANETELLGHLAGLGMACVRSFVSEGSMPIRHAPGGVIPQSRSFLLRATAPRS